jgi:hypothetical protein
LAPASVAGWQEPRARAGFAKTEDQTLEVVEDGVGKREVRACFVGRLDGAPVVAVVAALVGASVDVFVRAVLGVSAGVFVRASDCVSVSTFDGAVVEVSAVVGTAVERHWPPGSSRSAESARALTRNPTASQR